MSGCLRKKQALFTGAERQCWFPKDFVYEMETLWTVNIRFSFLELDTRQERVKYLLFHNPCLGLPWCFCFMRGEQYLLHLGLVSGRCHLWAL